MHHDADGAVIDVGRKTRTIPPSIRRALAARDTGCRFPGCTSRRCDAHHVDHWADGGVTRLDNLVLLCRRHHRAVHEGGFAVIRGHNGVLTFRRPDGAPLQVTPDAPTDLPGCMTRRHSSPGNYRRGTARASTCRGPSTCSTAAQSYRRISIERKKEAVGAVETVLWFPRSLWARSPSEVSAGEASTAPAASTAQARPMVPSRWTTRFASTGLTASRVADGHLGRIITLTVGAHPRHSSRRLPDHRTPRRGRHGRRVPRARHEARS